MYEKVDKELLQYVEDVLLNRRDDSTERLLEYAGTLEPKCKPTAVRKLNAEPAGPAISPKLNPLPAGVDPLAPDAYLPPVPAYKPWRDLLAKSEAFGQLEALMHDGKRCASFGAAGYEKVKNIGWETVVDALTRSLR